IVYKPPEYKDFDFSEAPKFTAPLSNHATTVGYSTKLLCAVRGCPKEWSPERTSRRAVSPPPAHAGAEGVTLHYVGIFCAVTWQVRRRAWVSPPRAPHPGPRPRCETSGRRGRGGDLSRRQDRRRREDRTPKVEWLKNQMVIGDDPKYRQISSQGVCSLEIRKPCTFDGGVYTCRAKNEQGTATVSCKLEVKQVLVAEADKEKEKE
ncbi:hypothetical protein CRUP_001748, partial [Coryphaenoides rupestris]